MDVARLNFSHGSREDHKQVYDMVRHAADAEGRAVGILADLQGPKIRLGRFAGGPVEWRTGEEVRITVDDVAGTHDRVSTTYKALADDARLRFAGNIEGRDVPLGAVDVVVTDTAAPNVPIRRRSPGGAPRRASTAPCSTSTRSPTTRSSCGSRNSS